MIEAGLAVVLATDFNPGSSPVASMPVVLSLACTQMKMTPAETITAATINAAWSLNLGGEVGSLEPDQIHTPGIFVQRIIQGRGYKRRIEQRTVRKRGPNAVVA